MKLIVLALTLSIAFACGHRDDSEPDEEPEQGFTVKDGVFTDVKKPPACTRDCSECSYLTCSIMSARIRNKLASMNCTFHPIFTALYSFHCAFFAGEPTKAQQLACTNDIAELSCGPDGLITLDDLPASCTTELGLPTDVRW